MRDQLNPMSDRTAQLIQNAFEEEQVDQAIDALRIAFQQGFCPTHGLFLAVLAIVYGASNNVTTKKSNESDDFQQNKTKDIDEIDKFKRFEWQDIALDTVCEAIALLKDWAVCAPIAIASYLPAKKRRQSVRLDVQEQTGDEWLHTLARLAEDESDSEKSYKHYGQKRKRRLVNVIFEIALKMLECNDIWQLLSIDVSDKDVFKDEEAAIDPDALRALVDDSTVEERAWHSRVAKYQQTGTWHVVDFLVQLWTRQAQLTGTASYLLQQTQAPQASQNDIGISLRREKRRKESEVRDAFDLISYGLRHKPNRRSISGNTLQLSRKATTILALKVLDDLLAFVGTNELDEQALRRAMESLYRRVGRDGLSTFMPRPIRCAAGQPFRLYALLRQLAEDESVTHASLNIDDIKIACLEAEACLTRQQSLAYSTEVLNALAAGAWLNSPDLLQEEADLLQQKFLRLTNRHVKRARALLSSSSWTLFTTAEQKKGPSTSKREQKSDVADSDDVDVDESLTVILIAVATRLGSLDKQILRLELQKSLCLCLEAFLTVPEQDEQTAQAVSTLQNACLAEVDRQAKNLLAAVQGMTKGMQATYQEVMSTFQVKKPPKLVDAATKRKAASLDAWLAGASKAQDAKAKVVVKRFDPIKYALEWTKLMYALEGRIGKVEVIVEGMSVCSTDKGPL